MVYSRVATIETKCLFQNIIKPGLCSSVLYTQQLCLSRCQGTIWSSLTLLRKQSIEHIVWHNIALCLHKHSHHSNALWNDCQEVSCLLRSKTSLLSDLEINMSSSPYSFCCGCQETQRKFNGHLHSYVWEILSK